MSSIFTSVGPSLTNFVENFIQQSENKLLKYIYKNKLGTKYTFGVTNDHEIDITFDETEKKYHATFLRAWAYYEDEEKTIDNTLDVPDDFDMEMVNIEAPTLVEIIMKMLKLIDEPFGTRYFDDCWVNIEKIGNTFRGELIKGGLKTPGT
ncbi:MAG: hypothetical protein HeimC3_49250 [Candidatus Heimdallarchaeota archaeon LC_3]|nr:MAG: hypothetical protein HeimC3_49250 [Candidatus Heimdallarchaeota archaeon LC_3]